MSELYLTEEVLETISYLRQKPIDDVLAAHLLHLFAEDGQVAYLARLQEEERARCPYKNSRYCNCGFCMPYCDGPLLDEVLGEIQSFERGEFIFNEKGEKMKPPVIELPF